MKLDLDQLDALLAKLAAHDVSELEWEDDTARLRVVLGRAASNAAASHIFASSAPYPNAATSASPQAGAPTGAGGAGGAGAASAVVVEGTIVTSPFVGTFYRAPNPEAPNFVDIGSTVKTGQTLCIVEAMKLMNEIESDVAGRVVEVFAETGKSVEYGQRLFRIVSV